jgi:hypothetical protein
MMSAEGVCYRIRQVCIPSRISRIYRQLLSCAGLLGILQVQVRGELGRVMPWGHKALGKE